jgi:hypothetical protein
MRISGATGSEKTDMLYSEELAGPNGMAFFLYKEDFHTKEDIDKAKAYLRRNRDVVKIYILDVEKAEE